jgi:hypothetical protein
MRITGGQLHTGKPTFLETAGEPAPCLLRLAEDRLKPENFPPAVFTVANSQRHGRRSNASPPTDLQMRGVEN